MRRIEKAADRFLTLLVPRITAKADPCSCSGHGCRWTTICIQERCQEWRRWECCNGCQYSVTCRFYRSYC